MARFSERYGYTKASDVIIRERITPEIQNAICTCFDRLPRIVCSVRSCSEDAGRRWYICLEQYVWTQFLNERENNFNANFYNPTIVSTDFIEEPFKNWYEKIDLLDFVIEYIYDDDERYYSHRFNPSNVTVYSMFVDMLNSEFERLNFAYRVVNKEIVEITSEQEIATIETAIDNTPRNIQLHLNRALELYAQRPEGDYRNSIKESISAVEAFCREKTGENTLGKALNKLEQNGIVFPAVLKQAFDKLYAYTNQPDSGIRHALMDDSGAYAPGGEEALFMLVSCSAFINYLGSKLE